MLAVTKKTWAWLAAVVAAFWALSASIAWAQSGAGDPRSVIASGANANGLAESIMRGLLGGVFDNPFGVGAGATTIFGAMFQAFNMFVFAAAVAWGTYGVASGIVQTAHEGVVLGKRLNAIWMPIRLVTGIGSLVPIFGGFSLSQAIMILALSWGINGANYITNAAIGALANFTPLTNPSVAKGNPSLGAYDLASALFFQELCRQGYLKHEAEMAGAGAPVAPDSVIRDFSANFAARVNRSGADATGVMIGTNANEAACMAVGIARKKYEAPSGTDAWVFRNRSVDYAAINQSAYQRYQGSFEQLRRSTQQLALQYKQAVDAVSNAGGQQPAFPSSQLRSLAAQFAVAATPQNTGNNNAIKDTTVNQIQGLGFLALGSYYSMLSEANTAMTTAQQAAEYVIQTSDGFKLQSDVYGVIEKNLSASSSRDFYLSAAMRAFREAEGPGGSAGADMDSLLKFDDPSGDSNFGQKVLEHMLGGVVTGTSSPASFNLIDPIVSAKNLGDYLMSAGATIIGAGVVASLLPEPVKVALSKVGDKIPGVSTVKKIGESLAGVSWWMLIVGALLALYIPFVPFLNWVAAMVQYVSVVVQSFVAAPMWSFAHVAVEGEGMGQRAERGYLFLLLVLFKPSLMVIAFFAAAGMVILIGSAVTWLFMPAVAHVQGNSVTGIFSIMGFVTFYFIIMNTIIQGSFNLVEEISDDVIGWIGQAGKSVVGRGMDERAGNVFIMSTKSARTEVTSLLAARKKA